LHILIVLESQHNSTFLKILFGKIIFLRLVLISQVYLITMLICDAVLINMVTVIVF